MRPSEPRSSRRDRLIPEIRRARPEDAAALTRIARAAKRHWKYPMEWIELWRGDLTVTPNFIRRHPVYAAVHGRRVMGFYALSRRGAGFELEHMWIHPRCIGTGVGRELFGHALATARRAGGHLLRIASDPNAAGFYRAMGARRVGTVPSKPAGRRLPLLIVELRLRARRSNVGTTSRGTR